MTDNEKQRLREVIMAQAIVLRACIHAQGVFHTMSETEKDLWYALCNFVDCGG